MSDIFSETNQNEAATSEDAAMPGKSFGLRLVDHFREAAGATISHVWSLSREFASAAYDTGKLAVQTFKLGFEGINKGLDALSPAPVPVKAGPSP